MTRTTPEQIARDTCDAHAVPREGRRRDEIEMLIASGINADRKHRDIYELIAQALDERAEVFADDIGRASDRAHKAAGAVRSSHEEDIWDRFIGPMLDKLEDIYGTEPA